MFGFKGLKDKSGALPRKPRDRTLKRTSLHLAPPRDAGRRKGTIRTKEESRIFSGCPPRGDFFAVQIPVDSHPEVGICAFPVPPVLFRDAGRDKRLRTSQASNRQKRRFPGLSPESSKRSSLSEGAATAGFYAARRRGKARRRRRSNRRECFRSMS